MNANSSIISEPAAVRISAPPAEVSDERGVRAELALMRRWMVWMVAGMFLVAVAFLLFVAAIFGALIDFHYGESILIAGCCTGGVVMGFLFGWLAHWAISHG